MDHQKKVKKNRSKSTEPGSSSQELKKYLLEAIEKKELKQDNKQVPKVTLQQLMEEENKKLLDKVKVLEKDNILLKNALRSVDANLLKSLPLQSNLESGLADAIENLEVAGSANALSPDSSDSEKFIFPKLKLLKPHLTESTSFPKSPEIQDNNKKFDSSIIFVKAFNPKDIERSVIDLESDEEP